MHPGALNGIIRACVNGRSLLERMETVLNELAASAWCTVDGTGAGEDAERWGRSALNHKMAATWPLAPAADHLAVGVVDGDGERIHPGRQVQTLHMLSRGKTTRRAEWAIMTCITCTPSVFPAPLPVREVFYSL